MKAVNTVPIIVLFLAFARGSGAIEIVLDYTLDTQNDNWFNPDSAVGQVRRDAVDAAAAFLSTIITNDDWDSLPTLNEAFSLSNIAADRIYDLGGNLLVGTPDSDGAGYSYSTSSNDINTINRSSVGANQYIVYIGAFKFDTKTTANATGGADSSDRRNVAGLENLEFNTWGGKVYFNTTKEWYTNSNPGVDPTDDYGIQDSDKLPDSDILTDNWDWSTTSDSWKGFQLSTIDTSVSSDRDLYSTALHELMHALGATRTHISNYVGVDTDGNFIGENVMDAYRGVVPGDGGHFGANTQSIVWDSEDIVSEVVLDPSSLGGIRKYFTNLDAALLRDLGYDVLEAFPTIDLAGDFNGNGIVDVPDYILWRNNLGSAATVLGGNGSGSRIVGQADFELWKENFGDSVTSVSMAVPEPSFLPFAIAGFVGLFLVWRSGFLPSITERPKCSLCSQDTHVPC